MVGVLQVIPTKCSLAASRTCHAMLHSLIAMKMLRVSPMHVGMFTIPCRCSIHPRAALRTATIQPGFPIQHSSRKPISCGIRRRADGHQRHAMWLLAQQAHRLQLQLQLQVRPVRLQCQLLQHRFQLRHLGSQAALMASWTPRRPSTQPCGHCMGRHRIKQIVRPDVPAIQIVSPGRVTLLTGAFATMLFLSAEPTVRGPKATRAP